MDGIDVKTFDRAIVQSLADLTEEYDKKVDVDVIWAGMVINRCAYFASMVKARLFGEDSLSEEVSIKDDLIRGNNNGTK